MFNNFTSEGDYQCCNVVIPATSDRGALLIGDFNSASDESVLRRHGIITVITSALGLEHLEIPSFVTHIVYPLKDAKSQNIRAFFDESYLTIDRKLNEGGVLVHCAAGVSRSATLIIAYLMKKNDIGFKPAINLLRSKRAGICPNLGFEMQLKNYEKQLQKNNPGKSIMMRKAASQKISEEKASQIQGRRTQNQSFFSFQPTASMIHSHKKADIKKGTYKPLGYSRPRPHPMYDVSETELFISGKRPSSQVRENKTRQSSGRKNPMMGTWGSMHTRVRKYEIP